MATKKSGKRGKKLSARKRQVKDLNASKASGVKGGLRTSDSVSVKNL